MRLVKLIIWIVVLVAGILFALYNKQTLQLNFLMLHSKVLPVWSFLIIAFVIGLMISFLYGLIDIMRLKTKIKGQANEIDELKKEIGYLRNLTITKEDKSEQITADDQ
ncbi:MAG: LapA family protein [Epsilonproteobacteria bacterium]|nr:LapA family protein [Campylobacterota bacterium]GMT43536.1 MAG: hypothetical protein IEMM0003_0355 [bacterium]